MKNSTSVVINNSITVVKAITDNSSSSTRPSNCSYISGNTDCIISNNILTGCTKSDKDAANKEENNTNCIIDNNIKNSPSA